MKISVIANREAALAPWLIGYLGAEAKAASGDERRVIPARPNCFVQVILSGGHAMIDVDTGERHEVPRVALFGPLTHYRYDMEIGQDLRTFCLRLQPGSIGGLLGIDAADLVDAYRPFDLPPGLLDALIAAPDWADMADLCDAWLGPLIATAPQDEPVAAAARRQRERFGQIPIQTLADSTGFSLRQFQRRFQALTGLNPKLYARVCRIAHAVHIKQVAPDTSWTDVAAEAGYADQSHFIRDFRALTGTVPKTFLRGQTPILREPRWDAYAA